MTADAVLVLRLHAGALMPARQTSGAAGFDLAAAKSVLIPARGRAVVDTGIALQLPPGIEAQVRPRSGLAACHGIGMLNAPGTIDPDYRGEIRVVLFNQSDLDYRVKPGDRIAQLVFSRLADVSLLETDRIDDTPRGPGGFGHTGQ